MKQLYSRTTEGLREARAALASARETGDDATAAKILLDLSNLVKWAPVEEGEEPFALSHLYALKALALYRKLDDKHGQISALIRATACASQATAGPMLDEAEAMAREIGDNLQLARALAARGRKVVFADKKAARSLSLQALELFKEGGDLDGIADTLFSLAIQGKSKKEKIASALESARIYREIGRRSWAAKASMLAMYQATTPKELLALQPEMMRALEDARAVGSISMEGQCYSFLAKIARARGDEEEAAKLEQQASELENVDA
ncbi:MAG: hypothetical protein JSS72_04090 [Armatimonadetes bacterium]|nr:hypothetical protein [Armatimonadota bacterium]